MTLDYVKRALLTAFWLPPLKSVTLSNAKSYLPGDPKKYSCLIKRKMHNRRRIFKNQLFLDYQGADVDFDISVLISSCHIC